MQLRSCRTCDCSGIWSSFFCATHELEQKDAAAARQHQLEVELRYDIEAAFWDGEYVTLRLGQETERHVFGDERDAGNVDLAALIAKNIH